MVYFYICAFITAASAFTSFGFSAVALRSAKGESRSTAMYAAARSIALALVSLVPFFYHAEPFLVAVAVIMILVQAIDAAIGWRLRSNLKTFGPAATSLANLSALVLLLR